MAEALLDSGALSAFCGSVATMYSAGIQLDEAVRLLSQGQGESRFRTVCADLYSQLVDGKALDAAMEATGAFPSYCVALVHAGVQAGRTEEVLRALESYYAEEERTYAKLSGAVTYPSGLLCVMTVILLFATVVILPVFSNVYAEMAGSLTGGSWGLVSASVIIGWVALALSLAATIFALVIGRMARSRGTSAKAQAFFERLRATRPAMLQLATARFASALSTYIASGLDANSAMERAAGFVSNPDLKGRVDKARDLMLDPEEPRGLADAIAETGVFEPVYARLLQVGSSTGSADEVLQTLSSTFFEDALDQIDHAIDRIEPALAAFLTVAVVATLVSAMLPLIGIMTSIG